MEFLKTFINGRWQPSSAGLTTPVVDSFSEQPFAQVGCSSAADVDHAVLAARAAFAAWSTRAPAERIAAVRRIALALKERTERLTETISREVGMPRKLASRIQVGAPINAWSAYADLAETWAWEQPLGHSLVLQAPVGVVACITPWNYPLHQITGKVAPALLAGCTVVLKPSELAPLAAWILAEAIEAADLPAGVFNFVHGTGAEIGEELVRHAQVDMISFTGSTRAGRRIGQLAGEQVKRVALELGGKSAAIVLPSADLGAACKASLASCYLNSGQTCSAITRLLVPRQQHGEAAARLVEMAAAYRMGDPADPATRLGPLASDNQRQRVRQMLRQAIAEGAQLLCGGPDAPVPDSGFFVAPTVLGQVKPTMALAQEEVFGPVLALMAYDDTDEALAIANGTAYGLAGAVWAGSSAEALAVARRMRCGQVDVNGAPFNPGAPFGGFKQSGIGRENGRFGIEEFVEPIAIQLPPAPNPAA